MDNFFTDNPVINISKGIIEEISTDNSNFLITISYPDCVNCRPTNQTVRLLADNETVLMNERGGGIPANELRSGMTVNASFASAMTKSIPPMSRAFMIQIIKRPLPSNITIGRIMDIDRANRSFTTISNRNPSSIIRFNVPDEALIWDRFGRRMAFSGLIPGMRVRIRHASFMTASLPPQTTAFEIRVI